MEISDDSDKRPIEEGKQAFRAGDKIGPTFTPARHVLSSPASPGYALAGALAVILLVVLFFDRAHRAAEQRKALQWEQQFASETVRFDRMQQSQAQTQQQYITEKARTEKELRAAAKRPPLLLSDNKQLIALAVRAPYMRKPEGFGVERGSDPSLPLLPEYPAGIVLRDMRPVFRWKKVADAEDYQVVLMTYSGSGAHIRMDEARPRKSPWQAANTWDVSRNGGSPQPLQPGRKYLWRVLWRVKGGARSASAYVKFETIAAQAEERLEDAALVSGIQQAQAGRLAEAERDFQSVLTVNPHNASARKLSEALRRNISAASSPGI